MHLAGEVLDDASTIRPDGLYGASKAAVEALTRLYSDKFGFRVANIRIGTFKERPETPREAATWLSHPDACRAFEAAMRTGERCCVFYGVSANTRRFWSLEPGRAVGYHPVDDAAEFLGPDAAPPPEEVQAGVLGSRAFTLDRM
jgi:uronate dehydrogenase